MRPDLPLLWHFPVSHYNEKVRCVTRILLWFACFVPLLAWADDCRKLELTPQGDNARGAVVDQVWSGTQVQFAGLAAGNDVYLSYYDAARRLVVGRYQRDKSQLCTTALQSTFKGWDSHNTIELALDGRDLLHVAGNMHGSPLVYGRATQPRAISGMKLTPMVGRDEDRTTYPRFLRLSDGNLVFLYREGGSGHGSWIVNRQAGDKWERLQDELFADRWKDAPISAYPSRFQRGPDGTFHAAIVWRQSPDAATNIAVSYVRTRDFKTWQRHDGSAVRLPITPDTADSVESPGKNAGLMRADAWVDPSGQPAIVYTRYGEGGRNAIIVARPKKDGWEVKQIAVGDRKVEIAGKGTLRNVPRYGELEFEANGGASIDIGFPGGPLKRYTLSPELKPIGQAKAEEATAQQKIPALAPPPGLEEPRASIVTVETPEGDPAPASLQYMTQGSNRDQPRQCTPKAPKACDPPPTPLYYVERAGS